MIDPEGEVTLSSSDMKALLRDIGRVIALSSDGSERRGLQRLEVLAKLCAAHEGLVLACVGD